MYFLYLQIILNLLRREPPLTLTNLLPACDGKTWMGFIQWQDVGACSREQVQAGSELHNSIIFCLEIVIRPKDPRITNDILNESSPASHKDKRTKAIPSIKIFCLYISIILSLLKHLSKLKVRNVKWRQEYFKAQVLVPVCTLKP